MRTLNGLLQKLDLFIDIGKTGYAESFSTTWSNIDEKNHDLLTGIRFRSYLVNRIGKNKHLSPRAFREQAMAAVEKLNEFQITS